MKTVFLRFGILICCCCLFNGRTLSQAPQKQGDSPKVPLERTEIRRLHSNLVGQEYELYISLPYSYNDTNRRFPVIFLLDPYRAFSMNKGFTDVLTAPFQIIPEVILVGIGYGGDGLNARLNYAGRVRDYTPVPDTYTEERYEDLIAETGIEGIDVVSGRASTFMDFLRLELFPFIDSNYRIDNQNKMLSGYSFGGTFALYSLFKEPELFDKYCIGSPSLSFKDRIQFELESKYSKTHNDMNARVFISVGEDERSSAENREMVEMLNSRNFNSLELIDVSFENENHTSCYPAAMSRGLIELYRNDD